MKRSPGNEWDDGWQWAYRFYATHVRQLSLARRFLRWYFLPARWELAGRSRIYRRLGVKAFGRVIPTGGIAIRRMTGQRMRPYTLAAHSLRAAEQFFFRASIFEALHLPFLLVLLALSLIRLSQGRSDLALENLLVNLVFNGYPILHHRHTRARIVRLLRRTPTLGLRGSEPS